jgi:hypothetical protein
MENILHILHDELYWPKFMEHTLESAHCSRVIVKALARLAKLAALAWLSSKAVPQPRDIRSRGYAAATRKAMAWLG